MFRRQQKFSVDSLCFSHPLGVSVSVMGWQNIKLFYSLILINEIYGVVSVICTYIRLLIPDTFNFLHNIIAMLSLLC